MVQDKCQHGTEYLVAHAAIRNSQSSSQYEGFVYGKIRLLENTNGDGRLDMQMRTRAGHRPVWTVYGMPGLG